MTVMTHAKFHFNWLMLTLIFGIWASEPPRAWRTTEKARPDRVKKFIYDKKNHPARIHFISFMNYVKEVEKIEQNVAHRKGKLEFHFQNRNPIKHLL